MLGKLLTLCLLISLPGAAYARPVASDGAIKGTVVDADKQPVADVAVTVVTAQQTNVASTMTDATGTFSIDHLPAGSYAVLAAKKGFDTGRAAVLVDGDGAQTVTVLLSIAPLREEITVTAEAGHVRETERVAQQVNVISGSDIANRFQTVLAEVGEEEEGVYVQQTSPTIGGIFVRGLTGKNVAVYVDGVRYTTGAQRGGISTFFNLNEPTSLSTVEILRGPNSAQFGSDSLGGTVSLVSRVPSFTSGEPEWHGEVGTSYSSPANAFGANTIVSYGTTRFGVLANIAARRVNTLRTADGIESHAAVTRFLGLPSNIFGFDRLPDTAFTQYSGTLHANFAPTPDQQIVFHYQRSQQDGGKRYDQLLGGDGNLVADLRNLMLDFGYVRYEKQGVGFFDQLSLTTSFNSQREERVNQGGNGNPLSSISHQYERLNAFGFNGYVTKLTGQTNAFLLGADLYHERLNSPAFSVSPVTNSAKLSRPRIPDEAKYLAYGFFVQDTVNVLDDRVSLSGALRYNVSSYKAEASDSPIVDGKRLWADDSLRVDNFAGRAGIVVRPIEELNVTFNYSRGFRAPDMTELGTLGLTGDGFEVASADIAGLNGQIGTTVGRQIVSSGRPVEQLQSEFTNNVDLGVHVSTHRLRVDVTGFIIKFKDTLTKQPLILPQGSVGRFIGDQPIVAQDPSGVVYVPLSSSPVLVRANFNDVEIAGIESALEAKLHDSWTFGANFTIIRAEDEVTGAAPNIEGGTPPATANLRLRYAPAGKTWWTEVYATLADDQNRLSALDLNDRRTGGRRTPGSIAAFFANGARVRGLIGAGADGQFATADDILLPTGETLAQVQAKLVGTKSETFLFPVLPGYGIFGVRGGFQIGERSDLLVDFSNIADKSYRSPSWGIDGPGRGVTVKYRFRF